jgi:hypothetical protein
VASNPLTRYWLGWVAALMVAGAVPLPATSGPAPTAVDLPFALPLLEGEQVKAEIGTMTPNGPATSYRGNAPAELNFSVWWWDTGAPSSALLVLDGTPRPMSAALEGDGDPSNGTLYEVRVSAPSMAVGNHSWYFSFQGPSGAARLPAVGNFSQFRIDESQRFVSTAMRTAANSVAQTYRGGTINLREAASRILNASDPWMGTDWDDSTGYNYSDPNHYIITPAGSTADDREAFVGPTGAQHGRYPDTGNVANNSQPAIKQALVLESVLLATGLFNVSDMALRTEAFVVNGSLYRHPFVRLTLPDGSEGSNDGPVQGDGYIDLDLWGLGATPAVAIGKHFHDDGNISNDVAWDGSIGWPPAVDPAAVFVASPFSSVVNVTAPDGTPQSFFLVDSRPTAAATGPLVMRTYWNNGPVVFDALSSSQSAYMDLAYDWQVDGTVWGSSDPIWFFRIQAVGTYTATLVVRDPFLVEDQISIPFQVHSKTRVSNPIANMSFTEDRSGSIDLRGYFADDDGFGTINFSITATPPSSLFAQRVPAGGTVLNISGAPDWCGNGTVDIVATDGTSPAVNQSFFVEVTCVNDPPVVSGLPSNIVFDEDTQFVLSGVSRLATDADGDTLAWSFSGSVAVSGVFDAGADTLTFRAPPNWSGVDSGLISVTDGIAFVNKIVAITVSRANDPPYLVKPLPSIDLQEDAANQSLLLVDYFSDPDGDALAATVTPQFGMEAGYDPVLRAIWFHPAANFSGSSRFEVRVRDPSGAAISANVTVAVAPVNDPPVITSFSPEGFASGPEGGRLEFSVTVIDSDSTSIVYTFALDGQSEGGSFLGTFEWQPGFSASGHHDLNVTVSDGAGGAATHHWSILISNVNRDPSVTIERAGNGTYRTGEPINFTAHGADPDDDALTYTWTFEGLLQPKTGPQISVSFGGAGNYTVKVTVSDGNGTATASDSVRIVYDGPGGPSNGGDGTTPGAGGGFLPGPTGMLTVVSLLAVAVVAAIRRRR